MQANTCTPTTGGTPTAVSRADAVFASALNNLHRRCDRGFLWIMAAQWVMALGLALAVSPRTWEGHTPSIHVHVWMAVFLGAGLNLPVSFLILRRPGEVMTRHIVAITQMLWSGLLVHLTGGRIETHFHVFGSLAFLAFYRDWRVILTATLALSFEHLIRGSLWPEAVYGISNPEWWRFLEHAWWALFEDAVLVVGIGQSRRDMRDLADRQEAQEALQWSVEKRVIERTIELDASREQFRSLVESLQAVPWEMDVKTLGLTYVGPQGAALLGVQHQAWLLPGFLESRVHEADLDAVRRTYQNLAGESLGDLEFRMRREDGTMVWVRSIFNLARDRLTPTLRGLLLDITARRRLELELGQAQKLESVGRLAAGVAHEINTPTQFIGDNIKFLRDAFANLDKLIEATREITVAIDTESRDVAVRSLETLQSGVDYDFLRKECPMAIAQSLDGIERVTKIVYAMKDFSHADEAEKSSVDINRVIRGAITVCRNEWKYVAELDEQLDDSIASVSGFASDLGQVIINLIVNAAHAIAESPKGEGKNRIYVRSRGDGDGVVIEVADTGAGIPDAIKPRIFEQFFTTKPVGKGTGQGLALTHRIVTEKHGGRVWFDSTVGEGTTFHIRLPTA